MTATPKDLQDEVRRLKDEIAQLKQIARDILGHSNCYCHECKRFSKLFWHPLNMQIPPESADETQPQTKDIMARTSATNRRLQELALQKSHAETQPQACEHRWIVCKNGHACAKCYEVKLD